MRYVVTGAAGFIGSHLAEALLEAGHDVLGIDCFTDYYEPALKEENAREIKVQRIDLAETTPDFSGVDGVFHLAGQGGARSFEDFPVYLRLNLQATERVFQAAVRDGARVVHASSSSVYGAAERYPTPEETSPRPISAYGVTKLAGEHLASAFAHSFELDVVVLRYFSVFGPRQRPDMAFARIARALADERPFDLYGDGAQTRGWTYVADAVDATIAAMDAGLGTYNVGGAAEASMRDVIAVFERVAGRTLEVRIHPPPPGEPWRTNADTRRIRSELGWQPRTPLEEGVRVQWEWTAAKAAAT